MRRPSLLLVSVGLLAAAPAAARTLPAHRVATLVEDAVRANAEALPGRVDAVDIAAARAIRLPSGPHSLDVRFQPGEDFAGPTRAEVLIRRGRRTVRRVWLTARVRRLVPALRAARRLRAGRVLTPEDLEAGEVLAERLPAGALSRPEEAVGLQVRSGVSPGRVLVDGALAPPRIVARGDQVTLVASYGVLFTPAVVIDGEVKVSGKVVKAAKLADILMGVAG